MDIYFAGGGGKIRHLTLNKYKAKKLYSFFDITTPNQGYGQEDRFKEDIITNSTLKIRLCPTEVHESTVKLKIGYRI